MCLDGYGTKVYLALRKALGWEVTDCIPYLFAAFLTMNVFLPNLIPLGRARRPRRKLGQMRRFAFGKPVSYARNIA